MSRGTPNPASPVTADGTCLGTTCLKWGADGELSEPDVQLVLQRLRRADAELCARRDPEDAPRSKQDLHPAS
jgi:hypothetical protein